MNHDRDVPSESQLDAGSKGSGLGKVGQVTEGKLEMDGLNEINDDILLIGISCGGMPERMRERGERRGGEAQ